MPDRAVVATDIQGFRDFALEPAHVPPLSVSDEALSATEAGYTGVARLVRAEEQPWNAWISGPRLFNNRWALVFEVELTGTPGARWVPGRTTLELNSQRTTLVAADSSEVVLADLVFWAYQEERLDLPGDLLERVRGAGPFRAAWLGESLVEGHAQGIVAFPTGQEGDRHVVALRLTMPIQDEAGLHELVWVFQ